MESPRQYSTTRRRENRSRDFRKAAFWLRISAGLLPRTRSGISPYPANGSVMSRVRIRTAIEPAVHRTIPANCKERCEPAQSVSPGLSEMVRATVFAPAQAHHTGGTLGIPAHPP
jgi:hypothetical protein